MLLTKKGELPVCNAAYKGDLHELQARFHAQDSEAGLFFFFFTLVTGPRRSLSLELSDTRVYEPQIQAYCSSCRRPVCSEKLPGRASSVCKETTHPGGNAGANLESSSHTCQPILVAFVWELSKETIHLPLGCPQGGFRLQRDVLGKAT